jgi:hypothetical protein
MSLAYNDIQNKRKRKQIGHSRMDNPEKVATLGTQDTRHKTKTNQTKNTLYKNERKQY